MQILKKLFATVLLISLLSVAAMAGETSTLPGETQTPPGETNSPPGETQSPPGTSGLLADWVSWLIG